MKLSQVMERFPAWYAANLCVYLKSPPGLGKTSVLSSAPEILGAKLKKNLGVVIINGPLLNPPDSIGYLMPRDVNGHLESLFSDPFWFRTREGKRLEEYDGGIIIVDEADKMDTDVKKVIGEAALSGRLGPHYLPNGWVIWMAGNRSEDRSGSTKELDHLINRRLEIDVDPDLASWEDWAIKNGVTPISISFAASYPEHVFSGKAPTKQGAWCTPRSLVRLDTYFQQLADENGHFPDDHTAMEEARGMIGEAAVQYFVHIKLDREMPKFANIVADPKKAKVPEKPDAQMLICHNLAHRVDPATIGPVIAYIERMPKEFAVTFGKAACKRLPALVKTPEMNKWALNNASLMAAITTVAK